MKAWDEGEHEGCGIDSQRAFGRWRSEMSGHKIIEGLKEATAGNFGAVTIEGQRWIRAPEWQPIEIAPKDGTKIDLLYPYPRGRTIDCMWRHGGVDGDGRWIWLKPRWQSQPGLGIDWHLLPESEWEVCSYPNMEPTHWMPVPLSPQETASE